MSTRATYTIKTPDTTVTYYIHHDGYPSGAAQYMLAALFHKNWRGSFADRFLRANDGAEHTGGKDAHGDTEFHYHIIEDNKGAITVEQFTINYTARMEERSFKSEGAKDIAGFINAALLEGYKEQLSYYKRQNKPCDDVLPPAKIHRVENRYYNRDLYIGDDGRIYA